MSPIETAIPTNKSIIVLLGGGHASGKKTTALSLQKELLSTVPEGMVDVKIIDMNHYKDDGKTSIDSLQFASSKSAAITVNNDCAKYPRLKPSRFKFDVLKADLLPDLQAPVSAPQKILIVHGLYALYDKEIRDMSHIKVFIDSDPDTRLIRWIRRDVLTDQVDSLEGVINAYLLGARSEMSDFIFPTKEFADVIMPRGAELNAVRLVIDGIKFYLSDKHINNDKMHLPENYLRPHELGNFRKERFDVQKNKFYELN
ncbi:putative uridine kinase DAS2 [Candida viswanathii]|uniref:Putative uridine kinase DAS2 n=1 Tax=Candida viswanathii TaxID=5486 RepID=A0A367XRC2_9ASCO|nr:putative uridine kinase DAS2 [Candida viswanathii]